MTVIFVAIRLLFFIKVYFPSILYGKIDGIFYLWAQNRKYMMKLIADSGSTKTAWGILRRDVSSEVIETGGINPVRDRETDIQSVVANITQRLPEGTVEAVHFYGAGCIPPYSEAVVRSLQVAFPVAEIHVESDLLGAARAMCGHQEGVVCILGTGSNSCYYDGAGIVGNVSPLGWILGDEGSGAVLGRLLVGDVLKEQLSPALCEAFHEYFQLSRTDIIEAVYRSPQPNRFLASLVPFLAAHATSPEIHAFLVSEFRRFLKRNVAAYRRADLPVHFVGGLAAQFSKELAEAIDMEGFKLGIIEHSPIIGMMRYHGG